MITCVVYVDSSCESFVRFVIILLSPRLGNSTREREREEGGGRERERERERERGRPCLRPTFYLYHVK